jgi:hypothetical protein
MSNWSDVSVAYILESSRMKVTQDGTRQLRSIKIQSGSIYVKDNLD